MGRPGHANLRQVAGGGGEIAAEALKAEKDFQDATGSSDRPNAKSKGKCKDAKNPEDG